MIFQNNTSLVQWGGNFPGTSCRHLSDLSSRVADEEKGSPPNLRLPRRNTLFAAARVPFLKETGREKKRGEKKRKRKKLLVDNYCAPGHRGTSPGTRTPREKQKAGKIRFSWAD